MPRSSADRLFVFATHGGEGHALDHLPLAVVDVETTGFSPGPDRVIEVAVVRTDPDGSVSDRWVSLVHPGRDVGPTQIHGISDDMVADAPTFADIAHDLLAQLAGAVVVAHNAPFDGGFLAHEFATAGLAAPPLPAADTIALARWSGLAVPNYKLATCCAALGLDNQLAHSALGDAEVTAELAVALLDSGLDLRWPITAPDPMPPSSPARTHLRPPV
jgi:DNA polymerase III subunit epsilon